MVDFRKMALDAKIEENRIESERLAKETKVAQEHKIVFDKSVAALVSYVLPLLRDAKLAFESEGIDVKIFNLYEISQRNSIPTAELRFQLLGPVRKSDKHRFETGPAFFNANENGIISLGTSEHMQMNRPEKHIGKSPGVSCEELVTKAVEDVLQMYKKTNPRVEFSGSGESINLLNA